jgi:hypothetical protein
LLCLLRVLCCWHMLHACADLLPNVDVHSGWCTPTCACIVFNKRCKCSVHPDSVGHFTSLWWSLPVHSTMCASALRMLAAVGVGKQRYLRHSLMHLGVYLQTKSSTRTRMRWAYAGAWLKIQPISYASSRVNALSICCSIKPTCGRLHTFCADDRQFHAPEDWAHEQML